MYMFLYIIYICMYIYAAKRDIEKYQTLNNVSIVVNDMLISLNSVVSQETEHFLNDYRRRRETDRHFFSQNEDPYNLHVNTLPETNSSHLNMHGWNSSFQLERPIFRGELLVSRSAKCMKDLIRSVASE